MDILTRKGFARFFAMFLVGVLLLGGMVLTFAADAEKTGTIRGVVLDGETREPIPEAFVFMNTSDKLWRTDAKGNFLIDGVPFGDHEVAVHKEGYNTSYKSVTLDQDTNNTVYSYSLGPSLPISAAIIKGKVYLEVEFDTVSGLYTADDAIVGFESGTGVPTGTIIDVVENPDDTLVGTYTTTVAPGTHDLFCWAYSHYEAHSGDITVGSGEVAIHDFHLESMDMQNSGLAGNITDAETGEPITGASVIAYDPDSGDTLTTMTDDNGCYFFISPPAGDYILTAFASGYDGNNATGTVTWGLASYVDIQLSPVQLYTTYLWGFVFGNGNPIPYGTVFTDYYLSVDTDLYGIAGLYMITNFPADEEHNVGANVIGYYPQMDEVTVPSGTVLRHDFHLQSMDMNFSRYAIVVASVWEDTTPRNPLPGSDVRLWSGSYDQTMSTGSSDNTVMFTVVPNGPGYSIKGTNGGYVYERYVYKPGDIHHNATDTFATDYFVINYVDIYMNETKPENRTEIWGFVYVHSFSYPVSGAFVMELSPSSGIFDTTDPSGYYQRYVAPGPYVLQGLFPGGYSVQYLDHATGTGGPGPWNGTVSPGESRHVDFIMKWDEGKYSVIAGQVLDNATHLPVTGFEVKAYDPAQFFPAIMVDGNGYFMFSPITDFSGDWTVNGHGPFQTVVHVEYDLLSSWTPSTAPDLPVTFTHSPMKVMWLNIYVDHIETPTEKTKLWGKVFLDDFGGVEMGGVPVMEQLVSAGLFDVTDGYGVYARTVASGQVYGLDISYPTAYSIRYYDHGTGATGVGPWSGSVSGVERRVDFAFKLRTKEYAEILGQVTVAGDGTPVSGFNLEAENLAGSARPPQTTDAYGFFEFNPVIDLSADWTVDGPSPGYSVVGVEYHLVGSGSIPLSTGSLPVVFPLSSSEMMWIHIKVKRNEVRPGSAFGRVYLLPNHDPAEGAEVKMFGSGESSPTETMLVGEDGLYRFDLPAGNYVLEVTLPDFHPVSEEVSVPSNGSFHRSFYLSPVRDTSGEGFPEPVRLRFVREGTDLLLSDLSVVILGIGRNTTGDDGCACFDIFDAGLYTVSIDGRIVSVSNGTSGEDFNGKVRLEPGKEYTFEVRDLETSEVSSDKGEEGSEVTTGVLLLAAIAALLVGLAAGYAIRRPGRPESFEE